MVKGFKNLLVLNFVGTFVILCGFDYVAGSYVSNNRYLTESYNGNREEARLIRKEKKYVKRRRKLEIRAGMDVDVSMKNVQTVLQICLKMR
jgi:hypothetical protein